MVENKITIPLPQKSIITEVNIMVELCLFCKAEMADHDAGEDKNGMVYSGFCTQYCFMAAKKGIKAKVPLISYTNIPHHNGHYVWPYINIDCGWCNTNKIEIRHNKQGKSNQTFCTRACYLSMTKSGGRRAFAKYIILRQMLLHPDQSFSVQQISEFLRPYTEFALNGRAIGSTLRVYTSRGTIKRSIDQSGASTYQIASSVANSNIPIGKFV